MIRAILLWVAVTAVFYGAAYFAWTFSPLISVGLALAHGYWHVRFTAVPRSGKSGSQAEGFELTAGTSTDMALPEYHDITGSSSDK